MRLLLIDYLSPVGHRKFDAIHISALGNPNHELQLIGRSGQFDGISNKENIHIRTLPDWMFKSMPVKPLTERLMGIIRLIWLLMHIRTTGYDAVIFLSYDVLSLFVYRISGRVYLINHNNVSEINESKIKFLLTRSLPSNYVHVALNRQMEQRFKELLPFKDVVYVPHGFQIVCGNPMRPSYLQENEKFVFCPVNRNYDKGFVNRLFSSETLLDFLSDNCIKIIAKDKLFGDIQNNQIISIKGRIPEEEYHYLMRNAIGVILPYSKAFKYRCSGILYECIALDKPVIASRIEAMESYEDKVQIQLFNDEVELVKCIKYYLEHETVVQDKTMFLPDKYWKALLNVEA